MENESLRAGQRVYLAARFSRRHECHALGQILQAHGCTITSRWTKPEADHVLPTGISRQAADHERQRFALEDMDDVRAANWTISLMEEPRSNTRGGRHIEFGVALALGHRLTIIGPRETVFHHLPHVEHFDTIDDFVAALATLPSEPEPAIGEREAVAYLKFWWQGEKPRTRVDLTDVCEPWLDALNPTITPLYAHPPRSLPAVGDEREALIGDVRNLKVQFERIAALSPDEQPAYRTGVRPFGTGDLRHFIETLDKALAALRPSPPAGELIKAAKALLSVDFDVRWLADAAKFNEAVDRLRTALRQTQPDSGKTVGEEGA